MDKKHPSEGFTLSLALVDALPVLFFGISCILVGCLFQSTLFICGAALSFLAGFGKVLWKLLLALRGQDIRFLNRPFRYLMAGGWLLILLSLLLGRKRISLPVLFSALLSFPSLLFFLMGLAGLVTMGILAKKLDSSLARNNWIEQLVNTFSQLFILLGLILLLL